jgi:hypothetical protein
MPRLFALDHNFPDPIVEALAGFQADASLVRVDQIDARMADLDDWELLLALHHHAEPWDGLITTDSSILNQGPELATLIQTKLTLVVAMESGHNPVKASGLLFAYLAGICQRTRPEQPQAWTLSAANKPPKAPWDLLKCFSEHNNLGTDEVWAEFKLLKQRSLAIRSGSLDSVDDFPIHRL